VSNYYLSIIILLLNCALQERPRADAGLDQGTVLPFMLVLLQTNRKGPVETSNSEAHITSPTTYLPTLPSYNISHIHDFPTTTTTTTRLHTYPHGHTDTTTLVAEIVRYRPPPSL